MYATIDRTCASSLVLVVLVDDDVDVDVDVDLDVDVEVDVAARETTRTSPFAARSTSIPGSSVASVCDASNGRAISVSVRA